MDGPQIGYPLPRVLGRPSERVLVFLEVMIVVGGQAPKAIRSVECYDFEESRWDQIAELPSRRCRAGKPPPRSKQPLPSFFLPCEAPSADSLPLLPTGTHSTL